MLWGASPARLQELMDHYAHLKRRLVRFVQNRYHEQVHTRVTQIAGGKIPTQQHIIQATDEILRHDELGPLAIDGFLSSNRGLNGDDREMVRRWTDSVTGVFVTGERRGRVLRAHNLVDELDYTIAMSVDDPEYWGRFDEGIRYLANIVPLADGWTFSGMQQMLDHPDERYAYGIAARLAQASPSSFFRNPAHLEQSLRSQERRHRAFVEMFGRSWVEGSAPEIERMHCQLMQADLDRKISVEDAEVRGRAQEVINGFELPHGLYQVESVGMLSHPRSGLFFLVHFGTFIEAFELPEADLTQDHLDTVLGYLEEDSISPAVFMTVAEAHSEQATSLFRRLLRRPDFQWKHDGEGLMQRHKADHYPLLPGELLLSEKLGEGLRWLQGESPGAAPAEQTAGHPPAVRRQSRKKQKNKKKRKGKTQRRSRGKKAR